MMEECLQWFFLNRANSTAAATLAPGDKVDPGFVRDFVHGLAAIGDDDRRARAIQRRPFPFLVQEQLLSPTAAPRTSRPR